MQSVALRRVVVVMNVRIGVLLLAALLQSGSAVLAADAPAIVRLAVVNTPQQSGLLAALLPGFEKASGYRVEVYSGSDVYDRARSGKADIVISHWGKAGVEPFVMSGLGLWPRMVFANQAVLVGPPGDPAGIRGMTDPYLALRKVAASGATFVCPANAGLRYLCEVLLAGAGNPDRARWYVETDEARGRAMRFAEDKGAYTLWGSFPFERFRRNQESSLEVMVWNASILQRTMATIVVNPERFPDVNVTGAKALEAYLLSPPAQAAVAAFREQGIEHQTWWPAARNNEPGRLLGITVEEGADD
jgi:tungstate transport system substrate-binding protein